MKIQDTIHDSQDTKRIYRPLWIEVDLKALSNNVKAIKKTVGRDVCVVATIKQQAYGHGLVNVAKALSQNGIDFFGIGSLEEAVILRRNKIKADLLILTALDKKYVNECIKYKVVPTVVDLDFARALNNQAKKYNKRAVVHVKIDTGMGRIGPEYTSAEDFILKLKKLSNLKIEGLYTHFPSADSDRKFTLSQIDIFNGLVKRLRACGIEFKYLHCANSIGVAKYKNSHFNMVRPGLILYGVKTLPMKLKLKPVLSLKTKIVFLKEFKKGKTIGYGRTYTAKKDTKIATIAVGYADGYLWGLSNKAKVLIDGKFCPLVGRVCMDHCMVDVSKVKNIKVGSVVTLIGKDKTNNVTASELAKLANTIDYEIVSRLSLKIPRIYK